MAKGSHRPRETKLKKVRESEGWTVSVVARAADVSPATLRKAEMGYAVRPYVWGKILKGLNSMPNKNLTYEMSNIRDHA
jgi:hypothetical protein